MVANIFPLFGLKIGVSVTSPHYPGLELRVSGWGAGTGVRGCHIRRVPSQVAEEPGPRAGHLAIAQPRSGQSLLASIPCHLGRQDAPEVFATGEVVFWNTEPGDFVLDLLRGSKWKHRFSIASNGCRRKT